MVAETPARYLDVIQGLRSLPMAGAVLHLGAHPDDEDIGLISHISRKYAARAVYWSATRGEGGQSLVSPYSGPKLGIFRTWETLAARKIDGGEARFGPFIDFGYSKTAKDTLDKWGRAHLLFELVRLIRDVQPHIVVSRWSGEEADEHGHHKAIGSMVREAVLAAGDPERFRELENEGLYAWDPPKLYCSLGGDWQPGQGVELAARRIAYERPGFARIDAGEYDPLIGESYQGIGSLALNCHQSQGLGAVPTPGDFYYYYELLRDTTRRPPTYEVSLYEGIDPTLTGLCAHPGSPCADESLAQIKAASAEALRLFRDGDPAGAARSLLRGRSSLRELAEWTLAEGRCPEHVARSLVRYYDRKRQAFEYMAVACLGVHTRATLNEARVIPGQELELTCQLWDPQSVISPQPIAFSVHMPAHWKCETLDYTPQTPPRRLAAQARYRLRVPLVAGLSCPFWLRTAAQGFRYVVPPPENRCSAPLEEPLVVVEARFCLDGEDLRSRAHAVKPESFHGGYNKIPLAVIPPISIAPRTARELLARSNAPKRLHLRTDVKCYAFPPAMDVLLSADVPPGWSIAPEQLHLGFTEKDETRPVSFELTVPGGEKPGDYSVTFKALCNGREYACTVDAVRRSVPGIPRPPDASTNHGEIFTIEPATCAINIVNVHMPVACKYAYVPGVDDHLLPSLAHFDLDFQVVSKKRSHRLELEAFDAVIVGVNAFLIRQDLREMADRLCQYVQAGGTVIVQQQGYGYDRAGMAPYPFRFNRPHDRVTSETAPVRILAADDPVMKIPNRITNEDFDGWVHDRGKYFFGQWDSNYRPLLAVFEPGEPPKLGGLMLAAYGRGTYVYSGLSFHRQLAAGVEGAVRLVANILAIPATRIQTRVERLRQISLFASLDLDSLQAVARIMYEKRFAPGQLLCREGEIDDELYIILDGQVEIFRASEPRRLLHLARPGEPIGELAALSDIKRSASMRASNEVHVLVINGAQFRGLMHRHNQVTDKIIEILVHRLAATNA